MNIYQVPNEETSKVSWAGDAEQFDIDLHQLGKNHKDFVIVNPLFSNINIQDKIVVDPNSKARCTVWKYQEHWVAKYFTQEWQDNKTYEEILVNLTWETNPDISPLIHFENDPSQFQIEDLYDLNYQMVWYLDDKFNTTGERVWAMRCQLDCADNLYVKDMGTVGPKLRIEYNPDMADVTFDLDFKIPWYELNYQYVWYIDDKFNPTDEQVWAIKLHMLGTKIEGLKDMGSISPKLRIDYNPDMPGIEYDLDFKIPWYELNYQYVWYIDDKFNASNEKVWAVKLKMLGVRNKGLKEMGTVSPIGINIEYNPVLPHIEFDSTIPWYNLDYEHVWYINPRFNPTQDEVWAVRIWKGDIDKVKGVKNMGYANPPVSIEYNPELPPVKLQYAIPWYDLEYEYVWYLDPKFNPTKDKVWAAKLKLANTTPEQEKDMGYISPDIEIEYNKELPEINIEYNIPWYDFEYEYVWYIDPKFNPTKDKV